MVTHPRLALVAALLAVPALAACNTAGSPAEPLESYGSPPGASSSGATAPATVVGSVDLTTLKYGPGGALDGTAFEVSDVFGLFTVTFTSPKDPADVVSQINAALSGADLVASLSGSGHVVITALSVNLPFTIVGGSALPVLGLVPGTVHGSGPSGMDGGSSHFDATTDAPRDVAVKDSTAPKDTSPRGDGGPAPTYCELPGSIVYANGVGTIVPGLATLPDDAGTPPDLTWLHVPDGYCVHYYATVPETRNMRFAPNGDLFVASPSAGCAGGANGGIGGVAVVPDDDHDGIGDSILEYMPNVSQVQGLLFHSNGYFYYQNATTIQRVTYHSGDRVAVGTSEQVADITVYVSGDHWPKVLDEDDMGNIFVTNGGDQDTECNPTETELEQPFQGGILRIDPAPGGPNPNGVQVAKGLRNPIALRCAKGTGTCFGLELAKDFDPQAGSREKLFPIRQGDDWGFPCCASANLPYTDVGPPVPDCSGVSDETTSFIIDHTPFGLDFEQGIWSGTWKKRAYVVLHGYFGSWIGARVVGIATDPSTGWPVLSSEADAGTAMSDFATGWDDQRLDHGRPAAIAFAPDGRMFVGQDIGSGGAYDPRLNGLIVWIAPIQTARPQ
jgi:glucose/arabinose dehydrogenase